MDGPSAGGPRAAPWLSPAEAIGLLREDPAIVYQLLIRVDEPVSLRLPAFACPVLSAGWYVYSGSARRSSSARLRRHCRRRKPKRWHIDFLLTQPRARVAAIRLWPWREGLECAVNQALLRDGGARAPLQAFGSSDCRHGCPAHLLCCRRPRDLPGVKAIADRLRVRSQIQDPRGR